MIWMVRRDSQLVPGSAAPEISIVPTSGHQLR